MSALSLPRIETAIETTYVSTDKDISNDIQANTKTRFEAAFLKNFKIDKNFQKLMLHFCIATRSKRRQRHVLPHIGSSTTETLAKTILKRAKISTSSDPSKSKRREIDVAQISGNNYHECSVCGKKFALRGNL